MKVQVIGKQILPVFNTHEAWSFLGGLFDGDGCVTSCNPALVISTSSEDLAFSLQERFNGSVYHTQRKVKGNRLLPEYNWRLGGPEGRELAKTLKDYTIAKHEELNVLINGTMKYKEKEPILKHLKKHSVPRQPLACVHAAAYFAGFFSADGHLSRRNQIILTQTARRRWLLEILLAWFPGGCFVSQTPSECNCLQVRWSQACFEPYRKEIGSFCYTYKKVNYVLSQ